MNLTVSSSFIRPSQQLSLSIFYSFPSLQRGAVGASQEQGGKNQENIKVFHQFHQNFSFPFIRAHQHRDPIGLMPGSGNSAQFFLQLFTSGKR